MSRAQTYPYGLVTYVAPNPSEKKGAAPPPPHLEVVAYCCLSRAGRRRKHELASKLLRNCLGVGPRWADLCSEMVQKCFRRGRKQFRSRIETISVHRDPHRSNSEATSKRIQLFVGVSLGSSQLQPQGGEVGEPRPSFQRGLGLPRL